MEQARKRTAILQGSMIRSAGLAGLAAMLTVGTPLAAHAQEQAPPRTSHSERVLVPGSLANRIFLAHTRHWEAWDNCDRAAAQAALSELSALADEARRIAEAAKAGGDFATIHPGDAADDHRDALWAYRDASARSFEGCPEEVPEPEPQQVETAPPAPPAPSPPPPPIEDVLEDIEGFYPEEYDPIFPFFFGIGQVDTPRTGIGFQRSGEPDGAEERFAGRTAKSVNTLPVGFGAEIKLGPVRLGLQADYSEGDASTRFDIPAGIDSGIVYGDLSPGGSSGISTPFGLSGETELDYSSYGFGVEGHWGYSPESVAPKGKKGILGGLHVGLSYDRLDRDYRMSARSSGVTESGFAFDFSQERRQDITDDHVTLYAGGTIGLPLSRDWNAYFSGSAGPYYYRSELRSLEINRSNFGSVADRDFFIEIDDKKSGWGWRAGVDLRIGYRIPDSRLDFFGGGAYEYRSAVGAVFNPNSGDQVFFEGRTTELRTGSATERRIYFGARLTF